MLHTLRRTLMKRHMLLLYMAIATLVACRCNSTVMTWCQGSYGESGYSDCYNRYDNMCPEGMGAAESLACEAQFFQSEYGVVPPPPIPTGVPQNQSVAAPAGLLCDFLKLTAPLDGLPNGGATFYWDPLPNATSYNISLFDNGAYLASYNAGAGATNLSADVSQGAIGGSYALTVILSASGPNGETCSTSATIFRAAPDGGNNDHSDNGGDDEGSGQPSDPPANEWVDPCPPGTVDPSCIH